VRPQRALTVPLNGWNRLFVVVGVVWALVAPFLLVAENNEPAERMFSMCSEVAYQLYGSSSSVNLDMDRYRTEEAKCSEALVRHLVSVPELIPDRGGGSEPQKSRGS
jgi:hypothetical protein